MRTPSAETVIKRYRDYVLSELSESENEPTPLPAETAPRLQLMTTDEVAELMNVSRRTVWELVRRKALSSIKIGGQLRFRREWIECYIWQQTRNDNGRH
jgi:excisionase family DNA binding protein